MSQPLKIAVLGFWHVHAGDYARADAATSRDGAGRRLGRRPRTRAGRADEFGVPYTDDLDALLARDDLDGVMITTATDVHRDVMVKAAERG